MQPDTVRNIRILIFVLGFAFVAFVIYMMEKIRANIERRTNGK